MIQKIMKLPHTRLRKRSKPIGHVSPATLQLIADMQESTLAWEDGREHEVGVALAAIQIDQLKRVVIVRNNFDNKDDRTFTPLINPEIVKHEGEPVIDFEGCLSVKNIYGKVARYPKVEVKAKTPEDKVVNITAEGFLARVLQHEIDHTNGILFVDRIKDTPEAFHQLSDEGKIEDLSDEERAAAFALLFPETAE